MTSLSIHDLSLQDFHPTINTLADMGNLVEQYSEGKVTLAEMILGLQLNPAQVCMLNMMRSLPGPIQDKIDMADWDESLEQLKAIVPHSKG